MNLKFSGMFYSCNSCALCKAKKARARKTAVPCSMVKGRRLFIYISSPSTVSLGSKKHWIFVVEDRNDYALSFFLKKKNELKDVMISLFKDLKEIFAVTMLEKMKFLNGCVNKKRLVNKCEYSIHGTLKKRWNGKEIHYSILSGQCYAE